MHKRRMLSASRGFLDLFNKTTTTTTTTKHNTIQIERHWHTNIINAIIVSRVTSIHQNQAAFFFQYNFIHPNSSGNHLGSCASIHKLHRLEHLGTFKLNILGLQIPFLAPPRGGPGTHFFRDNFGVNFSAFRVENSGKTLGLVGGPRGTDPAIGEGGSGRPIHPHPTPGTQALKYP